MSKSLIDGHTYGIITVFHGCGGGEFKILDHGTKGYGSFTDPVVWSREQTPEELSGSHERYPEDVRTKFESLLGRGEFLPNNEQTDQFVNLVEMIDKYPVFDTPCAYGNNVHGHAIYCHNENWLYAPRKCYRNNNTWPFEQCPGFKKNIQTSRVRN